MGNTQSNPRSRYDREAQASTSHIRTDDESTFSWGWLLRMKHHWHEMVTWWSRKYRSPDSDIRSEYQATGLLYAGEAADLARAREEYRRAEHEQQGADLQLQAGQSALREARARQAEAEENERKGIRPVIWPTAAERDATKARLNYTVGPLHVAISGIAGSGRSSLVNALRGLRNSDRGAAPTGIDDSTTVEVTRFPDDTRPCIWYDMPGAGTLSVSDWKYFTDQGLYIFDCIIVLFDARITETDIAILRNAARFNIPTYIVRSKALQHIRNVAADTPANDGGSSEDESEGTSPLALERARKTYIQETRANIEGNLKAAELPQQRVYLVDKDVLVRVVKGKRPKDVIDEEAFLQALTDEIHRHPNQQGLTCGDS